jgi:DNA-binding FrmR family transcriptional regulator
LFQVWVIVLICAESANICGDSLFICALSRLFQFYDGKERKSAKTGAIMANGEQTIPVEAAESCYCQNSDRKSQHTEKKKHNLVSRINRIEGQIRGVRGMIERDTYLDDVLAQIAAIQSALNGIGKILIEDHMRSCVIERIQAGEHEVIDDLMATVQKLMK